MIDIDFDVPDDLSWREARIPKPKNPGEFRKITIPNDSLKELQRLIYNTLKWEKELRPSAFAHGFVCKRSCGSAVRAHATTSGLFIKVDCKSFFDTFPIKPIQERFLEAGMDPEVVEKLVTVCSYKGTVPQGAPTSPWLTNVGMFHTDLKLSAYAKKRGS